MAKLFGTDGVRGIANERLTCNLAFKLGQVGAYCLTNAVHKAKNINRKGYQDIRRYAGICHDCGAFVRWAPKPWWRA